jgi:hypothetical protein
MILRPRSTGFSVHPSPFTVSPEIGTEIPPIAAASSFCVRTDALIRTRLTVPCFGPEYI